MKGLKKILTILWKIWFLFLTSFLVITIGVFWTLPLALSPQTFPLAYKGIRLWAVLIFYGSGFSLDLKKNFTLNNQQSYIFISNHTSILDIMLMAILHKNHPIVFVGKDELAKLPIFGPIYRRICITVDRSDTKSRTRVFKRAKEKINQGNSIVIFPEGGIPNDESIILDNFLDGAFMIAISTQVPLVVYSIKGSKQMFPWSWTRGYPGKIRVNLIDVIPTENLSLREKSQIKSLCYQLIYDDLTKSQNH
ncbi:MAG TPA: lysophospholipid acyltransferase family protein [Moheibacter sp.]|nr:lysophospholipid acyltransferase family protein [Moheibacter sp.]